MSNLLFQLSNIWKIFIWQSKVRSRYFHYSASELIWFLLLLIKQCEVLSRNPKARSIRCLAAMIFFNFLPFVASGLGFILARPVLAEAVQSMYPCQFIIRRLQLWPPQRQAYILVSVLIFLLSIYLSVMKPIPRDYGPRSVHLRHQPCSVRRSRPCPQFRSPSQIECNQNRVGKLGKWLHSVAILQCTSHQRHANMADGKNCARDPKLHGK